jgi:hypothetical protein
MFKIVRKAAGVSVWAQVEDLLVAHRELLGMNEARWLIDPEEPREAKDSKDPKDAAKEGVDVVAG